MEDYEASVNGRRVEPGSLMFHHQDDPFPGGMEYRLCVRDAEAVRLVSERYPVGAYGDLGAEDFSSVLGLINLLISMKLVEAGTTKFTSGVSAWVNNIRHMDVRPAEIVITGECSPHVPGGARP